MAITKGTQRGDLEELEAFNGMDRTDFDMYAFEDKINNPMHYTVGGYEAIDVIKAKLTPEEYRGACKANVLKYLMRANYKGHQCPRKQRDTQQRHHSMRR
jgi:hypothetical protein